MAGFSLGRGLFYKVVVKCTIPWKQSASQGYMSERLFTEGQNSGVYQAGSSIRSGDKNVTLFHGFLVSKLKETHNLTSLLPLLY